MNFNKEPETADPLRSPLGVKRSLASPSLLQRKAMVLRARIRSARRAGEMVALTAGMLPLAQWHSSLKSRMPAAQRATFRAWERLWAELLLRIFGMHLHVAGAAPPGPPRARLVVANHRSPVDILVAVAQVGGCVLSRADIARWPLLGPAAIAAGTIFVDRSDEHSGAQAIREIRRRLQAGDQVIVFPEGVTRAGDTVQPFHGGAFAAARGLRVEILPMAFAYPPGCEFVDEGFTAHMLRVSERGRTDVGVAIGQPYRLTGTRKTEADRAHGLVQELVHKARVALVQRT